LQDINVELSGSANRD